MHALFWPITDIMCAAQMLGGFRLRRLADHQRRDHYRRLCRLRRAGGLDHLAAAQPGALIVQMSESLVSFGRVSTVVDQEREPVYRRQRADGRAGARRPRLRGRALRLRRHRPLGAARRLVQRRTRAVRGAVGRDRFGQVVAGQPAAALLRLHRRAHPARRHRVEGVSAPLPAPADRHRGAGAVPLQPHRARQHHLRRDACRARRRGGGEPPARRPSTR
jgi:hypothetical protein